MGNSSTAHIFEFPTPETLQCAPDNLNELNKSTPVHLPGSDEYEHCRKRGTWMLDPTTFGKPAAICAPKTVEELSAIVSFLRDSPKVKVCVACGRHSHLSVRQGHLMIDMGAHLTAVSVDPASCRVTVQGGATIGMVDAACAAHKLLLPLGRIGTTGCAGQIITTGAHPYCERAFGLGVDYLTSATVVTGSGKVLTCTRDNEHADLFWAVCGGQTGVGIVFELQFTAVPAPNGGQIYSGQQVFLPTGLLGMPNRRKVLEAVVAHMDDARPQEYSFSATLLGGGGSAVPCILTHMWFGENADEGKAYMKNNVVKPGVSVVNSLGLHNYWGEIQKWGNGPKGEDAGPGAYYLKGFQPLNFTAEMGSLIADVLDETHPKGMQPVILVDLIGKCGVCSTHDEQKNAVPPGTPYWVIVMMQWRPEVIGESGESQYFPTAPAATTPATTTVDESGQKAGFPSKAYARQWVNKVLNALVGLDLKAQGVDTATTAAATAADVDKADMTRTAPDADECDDSVQHLMATAVTGTGTGAGDHVAILRRKIERAAAVKAKYDPEAIFSRA